MERNKRVFRVFTHLTNKEYENFQNFIKGRNQTISEYTLMAVAVLLEKDIEVEKRLRKKDEVRQKIITVRCSECVYKAVEKYAQLQNRSHSEVVAMALKEAIS